MNTIFPNKIKLNISGRNYIIYSITCVIILIVFLTDFIIPEQYNTGLLYLIPVYFISSKFREQYKTGIIIALSVLLLVFSITYNLKTDIYHISLINRGFEILVLFTSCYILYKKKESENKIAESEEQFFSAVSNSPVPNVIYTEDGAIVHINEACRRVTGYYYENIALISELSKIVLEKHNVFEITDMDEFFLRNKKIKKGVSRIKTKRGDSKYLDFYVSPLSGSKGGRRLLLCTAIDITRSYLAEEKLKKLYKAKLAEVNERKIIEQKLKENEDLLSQMLDILPVGIWFYDENGAVKKGNRKVHQIWETDDKNIPGRSAFKGWRAEDGQEVQFEEWGSSRAVLKKESSFDEVIEIETFKGNRRSILNSAVPVLGKDGSVLGAMVVNQDITELKAAEEKLREITCKLERSNKELEHFAYIASHDLQEPLRMVTSYMSLVAKRYTGLLDEKGQEYIGYAVDGAKRMHLLINDLLKYSRVTTQGKDFESTDLNIVIKEVISDMQLAICDNRAKVRYPENLPLISSDSVQMRQLFQNLIANAIKFKNGKDPEVEIEFTESEDKYQFSVRDNGIGISPEYFERIFVIFQRLHEKEKYPGTGIGLSMCKKIVERHGGNIWVKSEEGKGAAFFFTINKSPAS